MPENWQRAGFGLYIHWPFCQTKCPYCDFNSHVWSSVDHEMWADAFVEEITRVAADTSGRVLSSIFFGGGTPSLMKPKTVERIIEAAQNNWVFANDIEITLEANPTSIEAENFAGYRSAGVNRVSVGVQALNDVDLKNLGRMHTAAEARAALETARGIFDRISFDLIYARQNQSLDGWDKELNEALDLQPDHLSLYQLTIEPETMFGRRFREGKLRGLPDEALSADMYELTEDVTRSAGLTAYEISNYCRPDQGSRHNLIYWRGGDYVGIGPGAHGRITHSNQTRVATTCPNGPADWLGAARSGDGGSMLSELLDQEDVATEYVLMGLRISEGIDLAHLRDISSDISDVVTANAYALPEFVEIDDSTLRIRAGKRILTNSITGELLRSTGSA